MGQDLRCGEARGEACLYTNDVCERCGWNPVDQKFCNASLWVGPEHKPKGDPLEGVELARPLVLVESPFAGDRERNIRYLKAAMRDCIARGEAPFASHMLYTQFLDDDVPEQRAAGIECGLAWGAHAERTVVYENFGITEGMRLGIARAHKEDRAVEMRALRGWQ